MPSEREHRIGSGHDRHRLEAGLSLTLGGVKIDAPVGFVAHSDGDILLHALVDALLGAIAQGDIGTHFPDTDCANAGLSSTVFLEHALARVSEAGWELVNLDATIFAEQVKIAPHRAAIRERLCGLTGLALERISLKAKTGEGVGPIGRGEAMDAHVIVLLRQRLPLECP